MNGITPFGPDAKALARHLQQGIKRREGIETPELPLSELPRSPFKKSRHSSITSLKAKEITALTCSQNEETSTSSNPLNPALPVPQSPSSSSSSTSHQDNPSMKKPVPLHETLASFPIQERETEPVQEVHYFLCNEKKQIETLQMLSEKPINDHTSRLHIGFACWYNFDIMAERKSEFGVVCDIDENVLGALEILKKAALSANTREEFLDTLWKSLEQGSQSNFNGLLDSEEYYLNVSSFKEAYLKRGWLRNDENFMHIKNMLKEGRLTFRKLNLTDTGNAFSSIQDWIQHSNVFLDTLYTSNIPEWIQYSSFKTIDVLHENINKLLSDSTHVMTAQKKNPNGGDLALSLHTGNHPKVVYASHKAEMSRPSEYSKFRPRSLSLDN